MTRRPETLATLLREAAAHGLPICAIEATRDGWRVVTAQVDATAPPAQDQPPNGASFFDPAED